MYVVISRGEWKSLREAVQNRHERGLIMETSQVLKELKADIAVEMMKRYNAADTKAFEVSALIIGIIDRKIAELDGE